MDKIILAAAEIATEPILLKIREMYENQLRAEAAKNGVSLKPESSIKKEAERECDEIKKLLIGEENITRMGKGFNTVILELASLPNQESVLENLQLAGNRLTEEPDDEQEFELPVYDTLQEMFKLNDDTMNAIYLIGSTKFNEGKTEEALNVFLLYTTLNTFIFEPWLGLGSCWLKEERYPEALHAFTMASLLNFQHPAPHLFAAESYLALNKTRLAKETLELALAKMSPDQLKEFKSHIDYVKDHLKNK